MSRCLGNIVSRVNNVPCPVGNVRVAVVMASRLESLRGRVHFTKGDVDELRGRFLNV